MTTLSACAASLGVAIAVDLSDGEAWDLAQFLRRVGLASSARTLATMTRRTA